MDPAHPFDVKRLGVEGPGCYCGVAVSSLRPLTDLSQSDGLRDIALQCSFRGALSSRGEKEILRRGSVGYLVLMREVAAFGLRAYGMLV